MATYSNEPIVEIVSFTGAVDTPGNNYQSNTLTLHTVGANETFEIISCFGSADSGGARFILFGQIPNGYVTGITGLTNTGNNQIFGYIPFINAYYNSNPTFSGSSTDFKNYVAGANATQSWGLFYQLKPSDAEFGQVFYPGTQIMMTIDTYEHDASGEQAAAKMVFKKTTFPL